MATWPPELHAALRGRLAAGGCVAADDEADLVLEHAADVEGLFGGDLGRRAHEIVDRRLDGSRLEHVLGWAPFAGLRLGVAPGVFVPRRWTERLVAAAAARAADAGTAPLVVDLFSGCGAVACAVARALPAARVVAGEADPRALAVLRRNAADHGVEVVPSDVDAGLPAALAGLVDVLVADAPYVPTGELSYLASDLAGEPAAARDGGSDGLAWIRRVAACAPRWLAPGGWLLVECGDDQVPAVASLFEAAGLVEVGADVDDGSGTAVASGQAASLL